MKKFWQKYGQKIILAAILLLAAVLRWWQLGNLPAALNRDEAALAYNAYLVGMAGRDEWNEARPLFFKSFGDYKLPGYIYTLSFIFGAMSKITNVEAIFNDGLVRLPSALAGIGIIYFGYKIASLLLDKKKKIARWWILVLPFLLAVTPVLIWYSRGAWEANVGLFFSVVAIYLLIKNQEKCLPAGRQGGWHLVLLAVVLFLAVSFYNAPLIILTVALGFLPFFYGIKKWQVWFKPLLVMLGVAIISWSILVPLSSQKSGITIFNDPTLLNAYPEYRVSFAPPLQTLLGNKYVYFGTHFFGSLVASLSPQFLVLSGGTHPWHQLDKTYVHVSWAVLIGFYAVILMTLVLLVKFLVTRKMSAKLLFNLKVLILSLISLIPAVITTDAPHATRSLLFFVILIFLVWQNIYFLREILARKVWLTVVIIWLLIVGVESGRYLIHYFGWFSSNQGRYEIALKETLLENPELTQKVVNSEAEMILTGGDVAYNYILVAWYAKIPPQIFLETIQRSEPTVAKLYVGEKVAGFTISK